MSQTRMPRPPRPPLRVTAILFAFALNLFLVSTVFIVSGNWGLSSNVIVGMVLIAAVAAGVLTTFYVGARSGIHAFIGGLASAPVLALFVFPGNWSFAILAGSFCALGGIVGEVFQRRRGV